MDKSKNKAIFEQHSLYYRAKVGDFILTEVACENCQNSCKKKWIGQPAQCNLCAFDDIENLKKKNTELENNLSERDQLIENLKNKLADFEINSKENEVIQIEIVEEGTSLKHAFENNEIEIDNRSENSDGFTSFD